MIGYLISGLTSSCDFAYPIGHLTSDPVKIFDMRPDIRPPSGSGLSIAEISKILVYAETLFYNLDTFNDTCDIFLGD